VTLEGIVIGGIRMKVGFIGLGHLGKTIAKRLISQDVNLMVWNRTKEKALDLGVPVASTPAELVSGVDIVFLSLFDSDAVAAVLEGPDGLLFGSCRGKIIIDLTTNHFARVDRFYDLARRHGAQYLEAPVLGSVVPAAQGALTVLVSGDKIAYNTAWSYLEKIGRTIFYLEEPGLATKMKLVNNLVLGSFMATLAEAVAFGEAAGTDRETVTNILLAGAGNSMVLNAKKEKIIKEDFSVHFSNRLIYKDLHYLQDLANVLKRPLFTGSIAKELFGMTYSKDLDHLDFSAVYMIFKEYERRSPCQPPSGSE
jgi:3-hydroxyisobutyrate dehydrogenase